MQIFWQLFLHVKQYPPGLFFIYNNVSDPPSAIHVRILHPNRNFFPISLAQKKTYAYLCSGYKTIVDYPGEQRLLLSTDCVGFFYTHNLTYMAVAIP